MSNRKTFQAGPAKALMDAFLTPARRIAKNPVALLKRPDSAMHRVRHHAEAAMEGLIDRLGCDGIRAGFEELALEIVRSGNDFQAARVQARDEFHADPIALSLLAIIDAAHARFPLAPVVACAHPEGAARATLRASAAIHAATRARGERRSRLACEAAGIVTEGPYRTYVNKLWVLCQIAQGQVDLKGAPRYGSALTQVGTWLSDYALVVDRDAARIRNAVHHQHFEYSAETRRVGLWNGRGWRLDVGTTELIRRSSTLLAVTRSFQAAMSTYLFCALSELGIAPVFYGLALSAQGRLTAPHERRIASDVGKRMDSAFGGVPPSVWRLHGAGEDLGAPYYLDMERRAARVAALKQAPNLLPTGA